MDLGSDDLRTLNTEIFKANINESLVDDETSNVQVNQRSETVMVESSRNIFRMS